MPFWPCSQRNWIRTRVNPTIDHPGWRSSTVCDQSGVAALERIREVRLSAEPEPPS